MKALPENDKGFIEKIMDYIKKFIDEMKAIKDRIIKRSPEAAAMMKNLDKAQGLVEMYDALLEQASINYEAREGNEIAGQVRNDETRGVEDSDYYEDKNSDEYKIKEKLAQEIYRITPGMHPLREGYGFKNHEKNMVLKLASDFTREQLINILETHPNPEKANAGLLREARNDAVETQSEVTAASVRYSLKEFEDGTKYVHVDTDQHLFDNAEKSQYPNIARKYIMERFGKTVVGETNKAYVRRESANEYVYSAKKNIDKDIYTGKMRAATEVDNLVEAGTFVSHEDDDGRHSDAVRGWDTYKVVYEVGGHYFEGETKIKLIERGDVFYDITKIKDITSDTTAEYGENPQHRTQSNVMDASAAITAEYGENPQHRAQQNTSTDSIPEAGENSKQFSLKDTMQPEYDELLAENKQLKASLGSALETIKAQNMKVTDKAAVRKLAKKITNEYGSKYGVQKLVDNLQSIFDTIANAEDTTTAEGAMAVLRSVTRAVVEQGADVNTELREEYAPLLKQLRTSPLRLTATQKAEAAAMYGDYNTFRKKFFGQIRFSEEGASLDMNWGELSEQYPELFSADASEGAMVTELIDAVNAMKPTIENIYGQDST